MSALFARSFAPAAVWFCPTGDRDSLCEFIAAHRGRGRSRLIDEGDLVHNAPAKGACMLRAEHRTAAGERLLTAARDLLSRFTAAGTWRDPEGLANDKCADNVVIEIEYGEIREGGSGMESWPRWA